MADWREDRIRSAHRGENPMVMARMRSGFAVIGDTQHLPGYSLLLCDDPSVDHLTDLDWPRRQQFLFDLPSSARRWSVRAGIVAFAGSTRRVAVAHHAELERLIAATSTSES